MDLFQPEKADQRRKELMQEAVTELKDRVQRADNLKPGSETVLTWINTVFQSAVLVCSTESPEVDPVEAITLPLNLCEAILDRLMDILGYAFAFSDSGLYFLNDVGSALGFKAPAMRMALERKLESLRDEFSKLLVKELDATHRHWCAVIILKTILADGVIHPSEKAYFKVINTLTSDDPKTADELIAIANKIDEIPDLDLDPEVVRVLMWHIVSIAMFDGEYVGQEAEFVKKTAAALKIDPARVDEHIQPVAATFMVIQALFPAEPVPE